MSQSGVVTIGELITSIRQESDQVDSQFVTDPEIVGFLSKSYKELYDLLVTSYGEDYETAIPATFSTTGSQYLYPLPDGTLVFKDDFQNNFIAKPFYKLLGVDYQISPNNPQGFVTLKTFAFSDRNRFAVPNFASFWGFTNLRYRLYGNFLWFTPIPAAGQPIRVWYIPRPTDLLFTVQGTTTDTSTTMTVNDSSQLTDGMNIYGPNIAPNTTIVVSAINTLTLSNPAIGSGTTQVQLFSYQTTIDGISGWEEYCIVDVSIKIKDKEESDVSVLGARKAALKARIEEVAINRDPGSAAKTADVMSEIYNGSDGNGGWGYGQ